MEAGTMKRLCKIAVMLVVLSAIWIPSVAGAQKFSLILDWFPNIDHLPIYVARQQGYFAAEGLEIKIITPSETSDGLKMAAAGKVDIAVSYEPQTIIAAARGLDVVVFGRLIGHPLTTLLYLKGKGIEKPTDLEGKKIGYTVPGLMDVLLAAFARLNGIRHYEAVNVGFSIVQSLAAGKVDAVMGPFKTYETVELAHRGYPTGYFELEKHHIPDYDELVFITSGKNMRKHAAKLAAFGKAIQRAIAFIHKNPEKALKGYFKQIPEADRRTETDAFKLTLPYYAASQRIDAKKWQRFADFARRYGLIDKKVDVQKILWMGK
jgi:putative hydroxymethylpyrimidine transport system substrate-binding protein